MKLTKIIISTIYRLKPFIMKVLPEGFLKRAKEMLLCKNTQKLEKVKLLPFEPEKFEKGINLIGYIKHDTGLGQSTRLLAAELQSSKIKLSIKPYAQSREYSMTDTSFDQYLSNKLPYGINIFHINAHEFTVAYMNMGRRVFDHHYNIAFWLWELEEFPDKWVPCLHLVDEIWTPSEFVSRSLRKKTDKPVITVPYHVEAPVDETMDRSYFGLPKDQFLFLGMYDSNTGAIRKNPRAILRAFKKAFRPEDEGVGLVLKINHVREEELKALKEELSDYKNVYFILNNMKKTEVNSLLHAADVYISLHRSEGFGLVMAEAMLAGTPVIATGYSANTEFMNEETACMVNYQLVEMKEDFPPYEKGSFWAEPNIDTAAFYMQRLREDEEYYKRIAQNATQYIHTALSMEQATDIVKKRVVKIYKGTGI